MDFVKDINFFQKVVNSAIGVLFLLFYHWFATLYSFWRLPKKTFKLVDFSILAVLNKIFNSLISICLLISLPWLPIFAFSSSPILASTTLINLIESLFSFENHFAFTFDAYLHSFNCELFLLPDLHTSIFTFFRFSLLSNKISTLNSFYSNSKFQHSSFSQF